MAVTTREELKQYCLREIGHPVLEINVADEQLEDRIDEALEYWRLYHNEGIEKMYLKHLIKASRLYINESNARDYPVDSIIIGGTSGAKARVVQEARSEPEDNEILIRIESGEFEDGEIITDGVTISTLIIENAIELGEIDLKYLPLPDYIYGVSRVLPFAGTQTSKSMFDIQYQLRLNDLYDLTSTSIIYYKQVMGHLSLLDLELNGKPMFRFNKMQGRLYLDINWSWDVAPGEYVVLDCYRALDPNQFSRVWSELWLKKYTTALFKRQWGANLSKFAGLQLPGGVQLNGVEIYQQAIQEIKELEEQLRSEQGPCEFYLG